MPGHMVRRVDASGDARDGLAWDGDVPVSRRYHDRYFSGAGGWQEAQHVYCAGIELARLAATQQRICIAELGFGTGLNFVASAHAFLAAAPPQARLHYIGIDEALPPVEAVARAHKVFAEAAPIARALCACLPPHRAGIHRRWLLGGRVKLTLFLADVATALAQMVSYGAGVDGWYLDGFAPARNPAMWTQSVFAHMRARSTPAARLASFSVAAQVRAQAGAAGWRVWKEPGFATKRHCLRGVVTDHSAPAAPGHAGRSAGIGAAGYRGRVAIIGGGIAALSLARALRRNGVESDCYGGDAHSLPGGAGLAHTTIAISPAQGIGEARAAFHRAGFVTATHELASMSPAVPDIFVPCGALHPATHPGESASTRAPRHPERLALACAAMSAHIDGLHMMEGAALHALWPQTLPQRQALPALYNPHAGYVHVPRLLAALRAQAGAVLPIHIAALSAGQAGGWRLWGRAGTVVADAAVVVVAAGAGSQAFDLLGGVEMQITRGVGGFVYGDFGTGPVFSGGGAIIRTPEGWDFGATTRPLAPGGAGGAISDTAGIDAHEAAEAWQRAERLLGGAMPQGAESRNARFYSALRATCADHLPAIGPVPNPAAYARRYGNIHHGRQHQDFRRGARTSGPGDGASDYLVPDCPGPDYPGLFVLGGMGARGYTNAWLAAEIMADLICADIPPLARDVLPFIHPGRFLLRRLRRQQPV